MKSIKSAGSASYSTGDITIFKAQKMYSKDVFIPFQQTLSITNKLWNAHHTSTEPLIPGQFASY